MSDETKPEAPAPVAPVPAPAPEKKGHRSRADVEAEARHWVEEYRKQYPGDSRSDDELLLAPYGGYELAHLPESERESVPERLRRLSRGAKGAEKDKKSP